MTPSVSGPRVFISWVKHTTRSASLAQALGAENYFIFNGASWGPLKYIPRAWETWRIFRRRRPAVILCMNPPYFVGLLAWLYTRLSGTRFILDSHSAAYDNPKWTWMKPLHAFLIKRAVCSIVTNAELAKRAQAMGGRAQIVSDIPYQMPEGNYPVPQDRFSVCFVCNYASDEPVLEVLDAARQLPEAAFFITGNDAKATPEMRAAKPDNVTFTGYLTNEAYGGLLRGVSAILVLTTRDFTMQRGGSEAITVGKPLITSDWPTLRNIFSKGTVHVGNTAAAIHGGIETARAQADRLTREIIELRDERQARWDQVHAEIERLLEQA